MFVAFVLFSVVSAVICVGFLAVTVRDVSTDAAVTRAKSDAKLFARILQDRIEAFELGARTQARDPELGQAMRAAIKDPSDATRAAVTRRLVLLAQRLPNLRSATVVDSDGRLVASSVPLTVPVGTDFSKRDWFVGIETSDPYTSGAFASTDEGRRITTTSTRIIDPAGRVGVLVLSGGTTLQETIDQLSIDSASRLFVIDDADHVIAGTGVATEQMTDVAEYAGMSQPFATRVSRVTHADGYLVVRQPIAGASWSVLVRIHETAARGTSDHLLRVIVAMFVAGVLVWMAMAYAVARWLVRAERHAARAAEAASARRKLGAIDDARNRERARIAEELHDTSLQMMNAAIMQLDTAHVLAQRADGGASAFERDRALDGTRSLLRDAIRGVRRILLGLAALDVDHLELGEAIELAAQRAADAGRVKLVVDVNGVDDLVEPTRSIVYRLASELVSNAVRHGSARNVHLEVGRSGELVRLLVEDDGRGFDPGVGSVEQLPETSGLGLRTLARLHHTGVVQAQVESIRGRGTKFDVAIPVEHGERSSDA
ncbi:MAG: sensor signal transduction histidine kinase [Thermoleophilia bacterium]|nr:sensor signal transduction histidine kinase [Thermoleophilia bacterium]